ncbi:MAG: hypothetical protein ACRYG8_38060, partial [Janthinobacterium lividum]
MSGFDFALAGFDGAAVPQPDPLHRDRVDASLNLAFRTMTVANHAIAPVTELQALHLGKKC